MNEPSQTGLNNCGCCTGTNVHTPATIYNRPGLASITYRAGQYASIRQSLLAHLSDSRFSALQQLRTRDNDDFTVALLDAWAVTSDVLTFYQERIANESYLRTAVERLSVLEQSLLLGYQLAPGVAASTHLAFTMEEVPGTPELSAKPLQLAIGTRAQSVPGQDEQPQTFETIEAIEARPEWNSMVPQLTEEQTLRWDMGSLWLEGSNLQLVVGDVLLIIADENGSKQAAIQRVTSVVANATENITHVMLTKISTPTLTETDEHVTTSPPGVYVMRASPSPFGHNAPRKADYDQKGKFLGTYSEWDLDNEHKNLLVLSTRHDKIIPDSWFVIGQYDPKEPASNKTTPEPFEPEDFPWTWIVSKVMGVTHLSGERYGMAGSGTLLALSSGWKITHTKLFLLRTMTVNAQSEVLKVAALPVTYPMYGTSIPLNTRLDGLQSGRPIAVTGKRQHLVITAQADPTNITPVDLPGSEKFPWIDKLEDALERPLLFLEGNQRVELQPLDRLALAAPPILVFGFRLIPVSPSEFGYLLSLSVVSFYVMLLTDRDGRTGLALLPSTWFRLDPATDHDETIREVAFIHETPDTAITHDRDRTTLQLASPLANVYDRATVRLNANVAHATQGETVKEPLGSGDATIPYQRFTLRQPPLTYVSAETPSGSASTLKIYVNDVLWQEAPFFYGHDPNERIYILRQDDDGRTTVQFGDGINGARLPTGQNNVRAEYRKGVGLAGLLKPGQLSLLMSRPLGLTGVVNPEAPLGAEDPESRDDARHNAPTTVLTLDRAVSLQDYEDFARTFAGIAKAQAVWVWDGRKRSIFVTVAGSDGQAIASNGSVLGALMSALRAYGDPFVPLTIKSYRNALFQVHGTVTIHPDHILETVMATVTADLQQRYMFDARAFGQSVPLSEVIGAIQATPGVVAVDIDQFFRNDTFVPAWKPRLDADQPAMGADGAVDAAELLLLDAPSLSHLKAVQ